MILIGQIYTIPKYQKINWKKNMQFPLEQAKTEPPRQWAQFSIWRDRQILTGVLVTKIHKSRTMKKISLFNYYMLGYIPPITTSLPYIYSRNSCPTHILKPIHQTWPQASSHPGIFQTNLPLIIWDLCRFLQQGPISSTIFCKKLDFPLSTI